MFTLELSSAVGRVVGLIECAKQYQARVCDATYEHHHFNDLQWVCRLQGGSNMHADVITSANVHARADCGIDCPASVARHSDIIGLKRL